MKKEPFNAAKHLISFITFMFFSTLFAFDEPAPSFKISDLIRCLGQEELRIHTKHIEGPQYQLNQEFIVTLAGNNELILKPGFFEKICQDKYFSPSVALLMVLLEENFDIFLIDQNLAQPGTHLKRHVVINELKDRGPVIFINYLSSLQALSNDPNCLTREIPEIKFLHDRFKYLEEELDKHEILADHDKIKNIFNRLKDLKGILAKCEIFLKNKNKPKKKRK